MVQCLMTLDAHPEDFDEIAIFRMHFDIKLEDYVSFKLNKICSCFAMFMDEVYLTVCLSSDIGATVNMCRDLMSTSVVSQSLYNFYIKAVFFSDLRVNNLILLASLLLVCSVSMSQE